MSRAKLCNVSLDRVRERHDTKDGRVENPQNNQEDRQPQHCAKEEPTVNVKRGNEKWQSHCCVENRAHSALSKSTNQKRKECVLLIVIVEVELKYEIKHLEQNSDHNCEREYEHECKLDLVLRLDLNVRIMGRA